MRTVLFLALLVACQRTDEKKIITTGSGSSGKVDLPSGVANQPPKAEQITPPLDLESPPIDAVKTKSGLIYKKLTTAAGAPAPKRNDTVLITYR